MVKQAKKEPAVKEFPKRTDDELDKMVEEFLTADAAREAQQAAKREERRGE